MDTLLCETCLGRHMFMYLCLTRDMSQKWLHMTYLSMCVSQMYVNQWYFIVEDINTRLPHKKLPRHHFYSVVSNKLIKTMFIFLELIMGANQILTNCASIFRLLAVLHAQFHSPPPQFSLKQEQAVNP